MAIVENYDGRFAQYPGAVTHHVFDMTPALFVSFLFPEFQPLFFIQATTEQYLKRMSYFYLFYNKGTL